MRVKFEGEDGSGPGVNRGFFASLANALKNSDMVSVLLLIALLLLIKYTCITVTICKSQCGVLDNNYFSINFL